MDNNQAKALAEKVSKDKKCDYEMCYSPHDYRSPGDNPNPYWLRIGGEEGEGCSWESAFLAAGVRICPDSDCHGGMYRDGNPHKDCDGQGYTLVKGS